MIRTASLIILILTLAAPAWASVEPDREDVFVADVNIIVDGDTFTFQHRHLGVMIEGTCRLRGYNAPELRGKEREFGIEASEKLLEIMTMAPVRIRAIKKDRYGRWICDVWAETGKHVNKAMRAWLEEKGYEGVGKYDHLED